VLNVSTLKPLDEDTILKAARETGRIVTAEEAVVSGGLGGAIAETVSQHHPVPIRILGVTGFAPTGNTQFLLDHFGLNAAGIVDAALGLIGKGEH
jgi:transketolase